MTTDFELLDAWRKGDQGAGSELFKRHFTAVYGFFRSKVEDAAEDLTQQTFLNCVKARDDIRRLASFRSYLFVVARNLFYSHLKKRRHDLVATDFQSMSVEDVVGSPSSMIAARQRHTRLIHALRRLPVDLQIAIELYYVQRLRAQELVDVLGLPQGTVRSRIRRALEQLRSNMAELEQAPQSIRTTLTDLHRWAEELHKSGP